MMLTRLGLKGVGVALATCVLAGTALGQQSVGADVIVGELPDLSNNAAVGSIDAFAVGTTSCNKGNTPLNWFTGGTDNRHPVIGQNLFRLHNGRFEHIGQAWLKHGFTALQGTICTSDFGFGCSATAGTTLGVGCSDPYSSGLNNGQSGLGPKWQVNASTGLFPYPFNSPAFTGSVARRLQVNVADLNSTTFAGARYFIEGQYVCGDDSLAGNKNNNCSYREVQFTGGPTEYTIAFVANSTTQRTKPGIQAWKDADPTVTLVTADISGDGRYILGCKVTQTGSSYTYEYALQNINSHRSAASFTVPLPSGTTVTGVGYRDVFYHSSEPNEGTAPWTSSVSGTAVSWAGPAYAGTPPVYTVSPTDPNLVTSFVPGTGNDHSANALRWGTLYNFRFTTTVAPAMGSIQVGMFRPGTPSAFSMAIQTPGGANLGTSTGPCCVGTACSIQTQAACTGNFGTIGATCNPDPCQIGSCCAVNGACSVTSQSGCAGTWALGGSCTPNICPAPTGACCATGGACTITTSGNCPNGGYRGDGTACTPTLCASNDTCATALGICDGTPLNGNNTNADSTAGLTVCVSSSRDLWYAYTPSGTTGTVNVRVTTDNDVTATGGATGGTGTTNFDTVLSVHSTCGGTAIACDDDGGNNPGTSSNLTFTATRGTTYFIRVAAFGAGATGGTFTLKVIGGGGTNCQSVIPTGACCITGACTTTTQANCTGSWTNGGSCSPNPCPQVTGTCCSAGSCAIVSQANCNGTWTSGGTSCTPNPCAPLNDDCANRAGLGLGTLAFDTTTATTDGIAHNPGCNFSGSDQTYNDIWYNHPSQGDGTLVIDTCGSTYDTKIAVYSGFGCLDYATRLIACNDDDNTCPAGTLQSKVTIPVTSGAFYTIRVGGFNASSRGPGQITLTFTPAPVNGSCCVGTACSVTAQAACTGTWTSGGACGPTGNPTTCCPANYNQTAGVTIQDIFDFLNAWFAGNISADFNGGGLSIQDIFDFLNAWFAGC